MRNYLLHFLIFSTLIFGGLVYHKYLTSSEPEYYHYHLQPNHSNHRNRNNPFLLETLISTGNSYYFEPCDCIKHIGHRNFAQLEEAEDSSSNNYTSICGDEATKYGPNQKILSYSLFDNPMPLPGDNFTNFTSVLLQRLDEVKTFYPGWLMRVYSNFDLKRISTTDPSLKNEFCTFACDDVGFWCDVRNTSLGNLENYSGRVWRFFAIGDPTVDILLSRDLDGPIAIREVQVNAEFEKSTNKPFHSVRDTVNKNRRPIEAGRFGVRNDLLRPGDGLKLRNDILKGSWNITDSTSRIVDELLLQSLIYFQRPDQLLIHDSYHCRSAKNTHPFPYQRPNRHIAVAVNNPVYFAPKCPIECRPSYGKNWTYC